MPDRLIPVSAAGGGAPAAASVGYDDHKPRTPPPDLPSLLLDSRITYLGMPVGFYMPLLHFYYCTAGLLVCKCEPREESGCQVKLCCHILRDYGKCGICCEESYPLNIGIFLAVGASSHRAHCGRAPIPTIQGSPEAHLPVHQQHRHHQSRWRDGAHYTCP
jgi:hypothetical protein